MAFFLAPEKRRDGAGVEDEICQIAGDRGAVVEGEGPGSREREGGFVVFDVEGSVGAVD